MSGYIDPTKEIFAAFRDNNREGPIEMLNLVQLRAQAKYEDGRKATGAEAYAAYGRESGPVFERLTERPAGPHDVPLAHVFIEAPRTHPLGEWRAGAGGGVVGGRGGASGAGGPVVEERTHDRWRRAS